MTKPIKIAKEEQKPTKIHEVALYAQIEATKTMVAVQIKKAVC